MKTEFGMGLARILAGASFLALACAGSPAVAQGESDADASGLGEIIVTARKVNENAQQVPVALTAFSGEDLQNQNLQKVQDLGNFTPGLTIRPGQNSPSGVVITLRGQVQTDTLATLDPSVGTYVDGVYWARAYGLNSDILDVRSVEVLKGPQGTLFGRNTTGGALLINTNDPDAGKFSARAAVTYGRYNELDMRGYVNVPLVSDKIALRVAGARSRRDGYTTNTTANGTAIPGNTVVLRQFSGSQLGRELDNKDRWNLRGKLLVKPTERLSLILSGEYFDMDEQVSRQLLLALPTFNAGVASPTNLSPNSTYSVTGTAGTFAGVVAGNSAATAQAPGIALLNAEAAAMAANPNTAANNEISYVLARTYTYGLTAALDTDWGEIKFIGSSRKVTSAAGLDLEGSSYGIHFTESQQQLKQQSAELQMTGKAFNKAVDFALGAFVFHESGFDQSVSVTVPLLNGNSGHFYGKINNDSIGVYSQASWHITDALTFTGGLRYSVDDKGLDTRSNNYNRATGLTTCSIISVPAFNAGGEVVGPVECSIVRRDAFSGISYTAGLDYKIGNDVLVYAKTAKGFRSGGQNLRAPRAAAFIPFEPETAYSYEIGFKSEFFSRRLRVNAAAYITDVKDIQRSTLIATAPVPPSTVPGSATILGNAGKARFKGVELEVQAQLFDGFRVSAAGSLVDPKYVAFSDLSGDRSFERFVGIAKRQFSVAADYSVDLGSSTRIKLHADYAWRSSYATDPYYFPANPSNQAIVDATTAPALGLLGARAAVEIGGNYELAVFGRNLTNRRSNIAALLVAPLGYVTGSRQEPATYGVTASVKF